MFKFLICRISVVDCEVLIFFSQVKSLEFYLQIKSQVKKNYLGQNLLKSTTLGLKVGQTKHNLQGLTYLTSGEN